MALIGKNQNTSSNEENNLWVVSYADMMTLLFGFFVIIASLSKLDDEKVSSVGKELANAFSETGSAQIDSNIGERQLRALQLLAAMANINGNIDEVVEKVENRAAQAENLDMAKEILKDDLQISDTKLVANLSDQTNESKNVEIALPDSFLFVSGTAVLLPAAKSSIRKIAESLSKLKGLAGIEVTGHTDSQPPSSNSLYPNNWALSSARAGAVAEELVRYGVDQKGLITRGMSSLEPLFPEKDANGKILSENQAKNRRVQIVLKKRSESNGK